MSVDVGGGGGKLFDKYCRRTMSQIMFEKGKIFEICSSACFECIIFQALWLLPYLAIDLLNYVMVVPFLG